MTWCALTWCHVGAGYRKAPLLGRISNFKMTWTNNRTQRHAALAMMDITNWNCPFAVTLTLKQAYNDGHARVALGAYDASKNLTHFLNLMNKAVLSKAALRRGQKLNCIPVIEDGNVRPHYHLCLDKPDDLSDEHFIALVETCWRKTKFGYTETQIKRCDAGWVRYITKYQTKSAYADSIDWLNFHNSDRAV